MNFLCGLLAASLVTEGIFQLTQVTPAWRLLPVPEVALYGPDPNVGLRHRPNVKGIWLQENRTIVETSSSGLRDAERGLNPDVLAVVTGNSFIEALQVPFKDTAVAVAERLVRDKIPGTAVANLGIAGASPPAQLARLRFVGPILKPEIAVMVLPLDELTSDQMGDDSVFAGYTRGADGAYRLSHGFRKSRGYRLRTSVVGDAIYWLLDHSALARLINQRKNEGLFAEWPTHTAHVVPVETGASCRDRSNTMLAVWRRHEYKNASKILDAYIADLDAIRRNQGLKLSLILTGVPTCSDDTSIGSKIKDAIRVRLPREIELLDLDEKIRKRSKADWRSILTGFGYRLGRGHLNIEGNRIYGEIIAGEILRLNTNR